MAIQDTKTGLTLQDSQVPFVPGVLPPRIEKQYMNPIRYRTNYRIVPGYAVFCVLCLALGLILMEIDSKKFLPVFIGAFILMGAASVWLMLSVSKTRRAELKAELERYNLNPAGTEMHDSLTLSCDGSQITLDRNGLYIDGQFHWYTYLNPILVTSNRFNRVWLAIRFGNDPVKALYLPLCSKLIQAVSEFDIPLANPEKLEFLLNYKENAFAQIYNSGSFKVFSYDN